MGGVATRRRGLADLVARLQRGLVTDEDADEFLTLARTTFDVSGALLSEDVYFAKWNRQGGVPSAWMERYPRYADQDFAVAAVRDAPVGAWYLMQEQMSARDRDSDIVHQFGDVGLADLALVRLYTPLFDELHLVLYRSRGQRPFSDEDRALFELIYPQLAGALAARRAQAAIGDRMPGGAVPHVWLTFAPRRVVWTEPARAVWRRRLGAIGSDGWRRIEQSLWRATERFAAAQAGGRSQLVRADLRIELAHVAPQRGEQRRLLALLVDESTAPPAVAAAQTPAEELLSTTQVAIARATAGGWSAAQIARARRVSEETVRSHLKAIYQKLGVTRAGLAALVIPAQAPRQRW